jgi:guanylate kinase
MKPGMLMVVSGPAGVGKGTLVKQMLAAREDVVLSVSATTRAPRPGEVDGVHYQFVDKETFRQMIAEEALLEWVEYCGNYYGTPAAPARRQVAQGRVVLLEIEVEGALSIRSQFEDSVLVFVLPPSLEELESRLRGRGTETPEVIARRLARARVELALLPSYDYFVVNDEIPAATASLLGITDAERLRVTRNPEIATRFHIQ